MNRELKEMHERHMKFLDEMDATFDRILASYLPLKIRLFSIFAILLFFAVLFCTAKICLSQTVGDTKLGIQEIEVSLNPSYDDTIIVVGPQVEFKFPEGSRLIVAFRGWPGIGHIAEKDDRLTDGSIILPVYVGYNQTISFAVWIDDYPFPVRSPEYFLVVLAMPPLLDVNEDGTIDIHDRKRLKSLLGTRSADKRYDPRCNFNNDGRINRLDWLVFENASL